MLVYVIQDSFDILFFFNMHGNMYGNNRRCTVHVKMCVANMCKQLWFYMQAWISFICDVGVLLMYKCVLQTCVNSFGFICKPWYHLYLGNVRYKLTIRWRVQICKNKIFRAICPSPPPRMNRVKFFLVMHGILRFSADQAHYFSYPNPLRKEYAIPITVIWPHLL